MNKETHEVCEKCKGEGETCPIYYYEKCSDCDGQGIKPREENNDKKEI